MAKTTFSVEQVVWTNHSGEYAESREVKTFDVSELNHIEDLAKDSCALFSEQFDGHTYHNEKDESCTYWSYADFPTPVGTIHMGLHVEIRL